jgi:hypothetical protein
MKRAARCIAAGIAACACWLALPCLASQPSLVECLEASDFVSNAALSRDNGVSAQKFIGRMQQDFVLIHAFPQELRWFVHDTDDEVYLLGAARNVFERPVPPEEHRRTFLESCFERMAAMALTDADSTSPEPPQGNSVH